MFKVFYLEKTNKSKLYLRRYAEGQCENNKGSFSFHQNMNYISTQTGDLTIDEKQNYNHSDSRWPQNCSCGYRFLENDNWQLFKQRLWRRQDTGEEMTLEEAPVGAVWNADWIAEYKTYPSFGIGADGRCLIIRCPYGHDWTIDSRANNCGMPHDDTHKCWVRHGSPEAGDLHVDKNGHSCNAGAGSINTGKWHGFLHHGYLKAC